MDLAELHSTPIAGRRFKTHNPATTPGDCSLGFEFHLGVGPYRAAVAQDMAHKAIPLEPQVFLDNFLKGPCHHLSGTMPPLEGNPFEDMAGAAGMVESQISELFVSIVNTNRDLAHGLKMALSEKLADPGESDGAKIDAAFFRHEFLPTDGRPHWADQMVSFEFKAHGTANDPYDDREPGKGIDADAATRKQIRGQIIHYAEKVFEYQHRTSLFMLLIIGRRFRISRWDRSGTIVTRSVDYVDQPEILYEMLWYMSRLSDEALGLDPTAHRVMPGSDDYAQMLQAKDAPVGLPDLDHAERDLEALPSADAVFGYVRKKFADSLDMTFPWYRLEIPGPEGTRYFLVGKPAFCAPGMAGRGTKGFVALEAGVCPARFAWLKDAWRTQYEFVAQEGAVLKELNDVKVSYVPTLICHGDIPGQDTETPRWWERVYSSSAVEHPVPASSPPQSVVSSSRTLVNFVYRSSSGTKRSADDLDDGGNGRDECPLRRHKHYRIAVKEVGMKLVEFTHGKQLLQVVFDCMFAHQQAVVKANIMHRDISGGNILILPKAVTEEADGPSYVAWTGLLVDWELSKPLKGHASLPRPRQPERTGTWQFMSAAVLDNHSKQLEIPDELESFFHVTLYYAVRYLRSICSDVGTFIEDYFDTYALDNGIYKCGKQKSSTMTHGSLTTNVTTVPLKFGSGLDDVFSEVLRWFKAHYSVELHKREQKARLLQKLAYSDPKVPPPMPHRARAPAGFKRLSAPSFADEKKKEDTVRVPSAQELEDAAKVATHDNMLNLFYDALVADNWPSDRVPGDNVSPEFQPKVPVGPPVVASQRTIKKRRTLAGTPVSEPPRTPPRRGTVI
ncbi:hypothetical protein FKP32DRAFT_1606823 [Trametes sanguinea]|nr:hypothetical protein FKP32DRAFT_1606823 [Trametes sanguinea]